MRLETLQAFWLNPHHSAVAYARAQEGGQALLAGIPTAGGLLEVLPAAAWGWVLALSAGALVLAFAWARYGQQRRGLAWLGLIVACAALSTSSYALWAAKKWESLALVTPAAQKSSIPALVSPTANSRTLQTLPAGTAVQVHLHSLQQLKATQAGTRSAYLPITLTGKGGASIAWVVRENVQPVLDAVRF